MKIRLKQQTGITLVLAAVLAVQDLGLTAVMAAPRPDSIGVAAPTPSEKPRPVRSINVGPGPALSTEEAMWARHFPPAQPVLGLDDVIESLSITEATVSTILSILGNDYGLRHGIEQIWWKIPEAEPKLLSFEVNEIRVHDLLDKLVSLDPRYLWTSDGEYVNFILRAAYETADYPLSIIIPEFEVIDAAYAHASMRILRVVREQTGLVTGGGLRHSPDFGPKVTFSVENATPREILNEIARQADMSWRVRPWEPSNIASILMARRIPISEEPPFHWVGIRQVLERAGFQVHWNAVTSEVTAVKNQVSLQLQVGQPQALFRGRDTRILPGAPRIVAGHMQVAESFAAQLLTQYRRYYWYTPPEGH